MSILATIRDAVSEAARAAIHQWQAEMTSTANRPSPTPTAATQTHGSVTARPGAAHHAVQESLQPPPESTLSILDRDFILFDTGGQGDVSEGNGKVSRTDLEAVARDASANEEQRR